MSKLSRTQKLLGCSTLLTGLLCWGCGSFYNGGSGYYGLSGGGGGAGPTTVVRAQINLDGAEQALASKITTLAIHVQDPDTFEDIEDPILIPFTGNGQIVTVPVIAGTDELDFDVLDENGEELGAGTLMVNSSQEQVVAKLSHAETSNVPSVTIDPPVFNDSGAWVDMGPAPLYDNSGEQFQDCAGRVSAIASVPSSPNTIYLGTATSGVWKSTDGALTWSPLTDNQVTLATGALTLDPKDATGNTLYVGTGESNSNGFYGAGILKTTDGGASFTSLNPGSVFNKTAISRIYVSPTKAGLIIAGVFPVTGSNFAGTYVPSNTNMGPFVSTDGGATFVNGFANQFGANPNRPVTDVVATPDDSTIFVAVDATSTVGSPNDSGIYRSTDQGKTWTQLTFNGSNGVLLANTALSRIRMATATVNGNQVLYALVADAAGNLFQGVFASKDLGNTWVKVVTSPTIEGTIGKQSNYTNAIAVDPNNPTTLYLASLGPVRVDGIDLTTGAATLTSLGPNSFGTSDRIHPHVDYQILESVKDGANTIVRAGTDGGLWQLSNATTAINSTVWFDANGNQATGRVISTQMYGLAINPKQQDQMWSGWQDNGSGVGSNKNARWLEVQGGDGTISQVDPVNPLTVYLSSANTGSGPSITRYSDGAQSSQNSTTVVTGINAKDPCEFVYPFVIHPVQNTRLALGTNQVYETTNSGDTWAVVSGGPLAAGSNIVSLAYHPKNADILYAGLKNGQVFVRKSAGGQFTGSTVAAGKTITALAVDPNDATGMTAYAAVAQFNAAGGKVFATTNGGGTWTDISAGLPDSPATALLFDASISPNRLYVGTDTAGVFVRPPGGTFAAFGKGIPAVQVTALVKSGKVLAAGTFGKGAYQIPITNEAKDSTPTIIGNPPTTAAGNGADGGKTDRILRQARH